MFNSLVTLRIVAGDKNRLLSLLCTNNIEIYKIYDHMGNTTFSIKLKDYKAIKKYIKKTHCKIKLIKREGIYFFIKKHVEILFLPVYTAIFLYIVFNFGLHIYSINITGNQVIPDSSISKLLLNQGVDKGCLKRDINYVDLENHILSSFDEICFVSVSIKGSTLNIKVTENNETLEKIITNAN